MPINRRLNRTFVAWIAIFAVLCHALMPSFSRLHAGKAGSDAAWVCPHGDHEAGKPHPSPLEKFNAPHCGFCVAGLSFATPPAFNAAVTVAELIAFAERLPSIPNSKAHRPFAAAPRGPPALA